MRGKACSVLTGDAMIAARCGSSLLFAHPVVLGGRMLMRHGPRGRGSDLCVRDRLRLTHGALRLIGGSPTVLHVRGLDGRVNSAVCVGRIRGCKRRRLLTVMTRNSVSCTMYSRDVTGTSVGSFPRLSVRATVDFSRFCS